MSLVADGRGHPAVVAVSEAFNGALAQTDGGWTRALEGVACCASPGPGGEPRLIYPDLSHDGPLRLERILAALGDSRAVVCHSGHGERLSPADIELLARGFGAPGVFNAMTLAAGDFRDAPPPDGVRLSPAVDLHLWDRFEHPYFVGSSPEAKARGALRMRLAAEQPDGVHHAVAWSDGRPVGCATAMLVAAGEPRVGVFDVGVLPSWRRRGIGAAVSAAACRFGFEHGARTAALVASPMGEPVYARLGFGVVGPDRLFTLPAERRAQPPDGRSVALARAAGRGDAAALADLRGEGADLAAPLPCGLSPFGLAAQAGRADIAEWLLAQGAVPDLPAILALGWRERLPELLTACPAAANVYDGQGATPLHHAAWADDVELLRVYLAHGAEPGLRDRSFNSTPLGWARHGGRTAAMELLEDATGSV